MYYFGCYFSWIFASHHVLCCCWRFLFHLYVFSFSSFYVWLISRLFTFDFLVLSRLNFSSCHTRIFIVLLILWVVIRLSCLVTRSSLSSCWFSVNCHDLFFVCVEPGIKRLSMVALSYQLSFNSNSRRYVVDELTICHNWSYFNIYHLDCIIPNKQTKNKWTWFLSGMDCPTLQYSKSIYCHICTDNT